MLDVGVVIVLLAAITLLAGVASRVRMPMPVVLVLGGLVLGFLPGPAPDLHSNLVLLLFLPPLLYAAAYESSTRELRADAGPIVLLATGLVFVTVGAVAAVAHALAGLPWAPAFVLGAVLGPTDPVAAGAVIRRLGAPARIVTILEGESLVNDASAITAYAIAVQALDTGSFDAAGALGRFAAAVAGGVAIGLLVGWLASIVRSRISDPQVELALSLLVPFLAYIPANELTATGVLGAVTAGLYAGARADDVTHASARLQVTGFWQLLVFLLNAILFLLVGLQLPHVLAGIHGGVTIALLGQALAVSVTVVAVRMGWMFLPRLAFDALRHGGDGDPIPLREVLPIRLVLGWSAMRGAVSLAIALATPLHSTSGAAFPDRSLLLFLAYITVLVTLVVPGVTLGPLIRQLGLRESAQHQDRLAHARAALARAALACLNEHADAGDLPAETAERLRGTYEARLARAEAWFDSREEERARVETGRQLRRSLIAAQRSALQKLEAQAAYPNSVLQEVRRDLDLEEARQH